MAGPATRLTLRGRLCALRPTARLRLTMLYSALFLASGAVLLTVTNLLVGQATDTLPVGVFRSFFGGNPAPPVGVFRSFFGNNPATCDPIKKMCQAARLLAQDLKEAQLRAFELHELRIWSAVALGLVAVLSVGLGWLVAGRVLRPVRAISATARQIGASNLDQRLPLDGPDDEFRDLAATLNGLLARLQASFDTQRRFVATASHELRTPLTLDRALLERALRHPEPTPALWQATCERLLASTQQQDRLIQALLALARSEAGVARSESFELAAVIDSVLLSPELDPASQGLRVETTIGSAPVSGDARLVERLVRNLVDNAICYNQPHGRVSIAAGTRNGHAILAVSNSGPPIPPAEVDRLFQPFQRLTPDRGSHAGGTGLGLSIVKAIADAHQATITAAAQPHGGLKIEVSFPSANRHHDSGHPGQTATQISAPRRPKTAALAHASADREAQ
jgi:signal transduction histidine kinase